ncbi:hypothetical protein JCM17823_11180 [Halorubrum gandharaense]
MTTRRTLESILIDVADSTIDDQCEDGSITGGHNGPHDDPETPVRNTSHYLLLFARLYERTGYERYRDAAEHAADYLLTDKARPHGYTFHHRESDSKDHVNGTIGPAWTIEAIAEASRVLEIPELVEVAEEVFLLHPFDERLGLWKRVEIDGDILCFDSTLNHQLWFAAAGGLLAEYCDVDPEVASRVHRFMDTVASNTGVDGTGLFELPVKPPLSRYPWVAVADDQARLLVVLAATTVPFPDSQRFRDLITTYTPISRLPLPSDKAKEKKIGYHSFHLYGFAILKHIYPDHKLWNNSSFEDAIQRIATQEFKTALQDSQYGYPYNVSGIELAYALDVFCKNSPEKQEQWISRQFQHCWDPKQNRMARNNPDPETLTARVYEAARLSDWALEIRIS